MDFVINQAASITVEPAGAGAGAGAAARRTAPDAAAQTRFRELMDDMPPDAVAPPARIEPVAALPTGSLGDAILGGMRSLSADFQASWTSVNAALAAPDQLSVPNLLKLQAGMLQLSVQFELLGKATSRATQNIDQLVKLQ